MTAPTTPNLIGSLLFAVLRVQDDEKQHYANGVFFSSEHMTVRQAVDLWNATHAAFERGREQIDKINREETI